MFVSASYQLQSNILINDIGEASLTDFGLSRILEKSGYTTTTASGTLRYMAHELYSIFEGADEGFIPRVTEATDVWGFSMTVVEVRLYLLYPYLYIVLRSQKGDIELLADLHRIRALLAHHKRC